MDRKDIAVYKDRGVASGRAIIAPDCAGPHLRVAATIAQVPMPMPMPTCNHPNQHHAILYGLARLLVALLGVSLVFAVQAMRVEVHGNMVFATGPVEDDAAKFQQALDKPGVDTVVFVNSPGGDLWTGLRVGRMIEAKRMNTVIAGYCVSACSIMFMGGQQRSFSGAFRPAQTFIGIHGAHNRDTKGIDPRAQPQIFAFYKHAMGARFNAELMNRALYDMEDAGALLRIYDNQRAPKPVAHHCRSAQTLRQQCTDFKEYDALNLGIVTADALAVLELPASFRQPATILGHELAQAFADPAAYAKELAERQCTTDACRKLLTDFATVKEHKALAVPIAGPGLVYSANRDTTANAFVGALYACNHVKDRPARLCETHNVNGFDVRGLYALGLASHADGLAKLVSPAEKFYANEEYGGGMTSANGLRTEKFYDITPQKLDGIKTWATQELAVALKGAQPPVLVDVWAGVNDAIPGAVTLLHGGFAFEDLAADSAYEARFSGLLKLLSPDQARPMVFYCQGRNCWFAVNAALRARKLGYGQVGWYRGGMESWKAANLPMAMVVVRAVAR